MHWSINRNESFNSSFPAPVTTCCLLYVFYRQMGRRGFIPVMVLLSTLEVETVEASSSVWFLHNFGLWHHLFTSVTSINWPQCYSADWKQRLSIHLLHRGQNKIPLEESARFLPLKHWIYTNMQISPLTYDDQRTCIANLWRSNSFWVDWSPKEKHSESCVEEAACLKDSTCVYTWDTSGVEHTLVLGWAHGDCVLEHELKRKKGRIKHRQMAN